MGLSFGENAHPDDRATVEDWGHAAIAPNQHAQALELYARGYTTTREQAHQLVSDRPADAAKLLEKYH